MGEINSDFITKEEYNEFKKLRLVFEQTYGGIIILDKEFRFEYINPHYEKLSGYSKEELLGRSVPEIFSHKDLPESNHEIVKALLKGEKWEGELLTYTKNGGCYWASALATPYKDETGFVDGYIILQQDITERHKMEKALRESEAKYKTLVENSQDGIMIVRDGRVLFANNTICNVLGYCLQGLQLFSSVDIVHPDDRYKVLAIAERRRNQDFSTINESFRMIAKSGEIKECETTSTVIEFEGQWASFFTIHDVTDSKRMQLELKESEEKYRQLFAAESDAIFMIDAETGQILDANPATTFIYGYSHKELLRMKNTDISAEPEKTQIAARNENTHVLTRLHRRKDGSVFPVELSAGFTTLKNKSIQIITSRDITERIKNQKALTKSEQKYRELTEMLPLAVYELDANGIPTYMNQSGFKLFGIEKGDAKGKNAVSFFSTEDSDRMKLNLKTEAERLAKDGDKPEAIVSPAAEYLAKRADGTMFPVLIYGTAIIENEKVVGSRGIIVDISERKTMENALRESEEKYRTLIENATDGIVIVQDGLLKFANKTMCEIMKYNYEDLLNKPFLDYIDGADHELLNQFHKRRMDGEQFSNIFRSRFIRSDQKMITVELNARTSNYNGRPAGFIVIRNITYRLKIENELQQAKSELEKLNSQLEKRVKESSKHLTEARTQLINLQKENLQSQYDVLKQQVNPHFLFNSLNVLTSLIKLEPDLAEKFSEQLSKVYRYVLENKDNELVDLHTELNFLDAYIFLLNIRFVGKLKVNINIPDNRRNDRIIPLAMQLLIENAIKHNTMSKSEPLIIDVFIDSENNLNIINNLQERPSQLVSTGVGLKNIQNRYELLNNTRPVFEKTAHHFIARVPLVLA